MKIYFEDGSLDNQTKRPNNTAIIDASAGYSKNIDSIEVLITINSKLDVWTNSIAILNNDYCWNDELQIPELYLRDPNTNEFVRVDCLTDKEIHKCHNLMAMYINNAFKTH